jgi:hypothetical protein
VRLALEPGRGRTAVPVRAALAGIVAAVCAVTAAASFGASLAQLVATPPAYGVTWDLTVGSFTSTATAEPVAKRLVSHPEAAAAAVRLGFIASIDGQDISAVAIEPRKGSLPAPVVQGHQPRGPEEIALGRPPCAASTSRSATPSSLAIFGSWRALGSSAAPC